MTDSATVASGRGEITPWIPAVLESLGYDVDTVVADRPEDGRYYLPPGVVDRVARRVEETDPALLVVDGEPHVGQLVDLADRLAPVTVRDRAALVWTSLAGSNPVAEGRLELRDARRERRVTERRRREGELRSPDGDGGLVDELNRRCDGQRARLESATRRARKRVRTSHVRADAYVVIVSRVDASSYVRRDSCRADGPASPSAPARAETDRMDVGPHDVAVTNAPGIPWCGHVPDWFESVVPGTVEALERADIVLGHRSSVGPVERFADRFDAVPVTVDVATPERMREAIDSVLPKSDLAVTLPYTDEGQSTVSWLYDAMTVSDVRYGGRIELDVSVPKDETTAVSRRIRDAGGTVRPDME